MVHALLGQAERFANGVADNVSSKVCYFRSISGDQRRINDPDLSYCVIYVDSALFAQETVSGADNHGLHGKLVHFGKRFTVSEIPRFDSRRELSRSSLSLPLIEPTVLLQVVARSTGNLPVRITYFWCARREQMDTAPGETICRPPDVSGGGWRRSKISERSLRDTA